MSAAAVPAAAHGVTVVKPGDSIQAAVDAADEGSTIVVRRGTYAENVVVTTDGVRLHGRHAKLVPPAAPAPNACSFGEPAVEGICAVGQLKFADPEGPPVVIDPISDVKVSGFKVEGFEAAVCCSWARRTGAAEWNRTHDNEEYGVASLFSSHGEIVGNEASGSAEAGLYVGDSPDADVLIAANRTYDNELFGIFLRDTANGRVVANRS